MGMPRRKFRWLGAVFAILALVTVDVIKVGNVVATEVQTDVAKVVKVQLTDQAGTVLTESTADTEQILDLELDLDSNQLNEDGFISLELTPTTVALAQDEQELTPEINGEQQSDLKLKYGYNNDKQSYGLSYDYNQYKTLQDQTIELDFKVPVVTGTKNVNTGGDQINLKIGGNQDPYLVGSMVIKTANESSAEAASNSDSQTTESTAKTNEADEDDGQSDTATSDTAADTSTKAGLTYDPTTTLKDSITASQTTIQMDTFASKFEIYSKNAQDNDQITVSTDKTTIVTDPAGWRYEDYTTVEGVKEGYYRSYNQSSDAKASSVLYSTEADFAGEKVVVNYGQVGTYVNAANETRSMGAMLTVTGITNGNWPGWGVNLPYLDFSNNFYSGLVYGRIGQMNITVTYYDAETLNKLDVQTTDSDVGSSFFTFGSLNGTEGAKAIDNREGKLSEKTLIQKEEYWYQGTSDDFDDELGSTTFENSAVAFKIKGTDHEFAIKSGYGFTWQSFMSATVSPKEPEAPTKTVTKADKPGDQNELDIYTEGQEDVNLSKPDKIEKHSYFIYQPTYLLSETSVAKPTNIILEDTLPEGVTLVEDGEKAKITLFNTDGEKMSSSSEGLTITTDANNIQSIKYELSDDQITALNFNGEAYSYRLDVQVDHVRYAGKHHIMENEATVTFDSGANYKWTNPTNIVATQITTDDEEKTVEASLIKYGQSKTNLGNFDTPLKGVSFKITGENIDSTVSTNADGIIEFEDLTPGAEDTLEEVETIDGYVLLEGQIKFTVDQDGKLTITNDGPAKIVDNQIVVNNELVLNNKTFKKVDGDDNSKVLQGAEFKIRKSTSENLYAQFVDNKFTKWGTKEAATVFTSGADGQFTIGQMPYGTYQLEEVNPPAGYAKPGGNFVFTINKESHETENIRVIENHLYNLPVTGGLGIWLLIGAGLLTMGASWYLYRRTRKHTL